MKSLFEIKTMELARLCQLRRVTSSPNYFGHNEQSKIRQERVAQENKIQADIDKKIDALHRELKGLDEVRI